MPKVFLSAIASPNGWPEKGRHIGGQKAECCLISIAILDILRELSALRYPVHYVDCAGTQPVE
jgi:hypothetical protein